METDFFLVLRWWGTLFLVGAVAYPLTKALFGGLTRSDLVRKQGRTLTAAWWDGGYFFSKVVGMAAVTWIVYALGTIRILPFSYASITTSLVLLFIIGLLANFQFSIFNFQSIFKFNKNLENSPVKQFTLILFEELFFLFALLFWSWIKGHEPSIRGLEKFMDFGFMQSILTSRFFPPADMWYPPLPVNYYYFGHLVTAVLTKLSGIDLAYTFNLMLATIFALTLTMSFSIGYQLCRIGRIGRIGQIGGGILTAFLVTLAGNLQTIYAFTRGYTGDNVQPFWELWWPTPLRQGFAGQVGEIWANLLQGLNTYWYANATRFIPFTIHEFPSYSFVVSDVHGHVLSIPFVLLTIALLIHIFSSGIHKENFHFLTSLAGRQVFKFQSFFQIMFYGFLIGVLLMTNALDGPIYLGLYIVLSLILNTKYQILSKDWWKQQGIILGGVTLIAVLTSLPFLSHFKSFVSGVAVNCPPAFLANTKIGPLLFEGVEKCQRSPLWMMGLLWGFFVCCGIWLIAKMNTKITQIEKILLIFFFFSLALIIFPEFFYFKDIYPMHFRSNTMFKLGYQAFILFSIVAGFTIVSMCQRVNVSKKKRILFFVLLVPQLFLVSIYPIFSVRSYFNGLRRYEGLYGLNWLAREYPDDWAGIQYLNQGIGIRGLGEDKNVLIPNTKYETPNTVIVEADGDSYTDYARFSAFTGMPTIIGWPVHEWLWRGSYDVVAPRREEVRQIYESEDLDLTRSDLVRYGVRYVIVGQLEREKYQDLQEWKFGQLGEVVFQSGQTTIYKID